MIRPPSKSPDDSSGNGNDSKSKLRSAPKPEKLSPEEQENLDIGLRIAKKSIKSLKMGGENWIPAVIESANINRIIKSLTEGILEEIGPIPEEVKLSDNVKEAIKDLFSDSPIEAHVNETAIEILKIIKNEKEDLRKDIRIRDSIIEMTDRINIQELKKYILGVIQEESTTGNFGEVNERHIEPKPERHLTLLKSE